MNYAIGIVAHMKRQQMACTLADQVGADYISMDDGTLGCEGNHRHVWEWHTEHTQTGWAVTLEDDAVPCDNFRQQLNQALAVAPTRIVSFYLGYSHPEWNWLYPANLAIANAGTACWLTHPKLLHAVAYAIHTDLLPLHLDTEGLAIDTAISNWALQHSHTVAYTLPSLCDHADTQPVITTRHDSRTRTSPRKAWRHGTRERWTNTTKPM